MGANAGARFLRAASTRRRWRSGSALPPGRVALSARMSLWNGWKTWLDGLYARSGGGGGPTRTGHWQRQPEARYRSKLGIEYTVPDLLGEREYHEAIYAGFAQSHFARPAVRAFRRHLAARILARTRAGPTSHLLSLGCGIGDTELLVAPHVGKLIGIDFSAAAIRQARADAAHAGLRNVEFLAGDLSSLELPAHSFDIVIAVFFLHHLPPAELEATVRRLPLLLKPGGIFHSLDPSRYRLTGALGRILVPNLMRKYRSPGERELAPAATGELFRRAGFAVEVRFYDFLSTPCAGLFPGAPRLYRLARSADEVLVRLPLIHRLGSNFEILARAPA